MSRINLIALAAFVGLLAWVFFLPGETTRKIQSTVLSVFSPFQKTGKTIEDGVETMLRPGRSPEELARENNELLKRVAMLQIRAQELDRLTDENNRFREMLRFESSSQLQLIPARVVGRSSSTWWNTVVIDRGWRQNVSVDSPVRTDLGLVGKTALVNANESTVILLTDERCQVGARIEGTTERGILMGTRGATKTSPDLRLRFLSKDAQPAPGSKVYSSNDGGLFPSGILLGEVREFAVKDIYGEALVRPAVDFSDLKYVFVIEREDEPAPASGGGVAPEGDAVTAAPGAGP